MKFVVWILIALSAAMVVEVSSQRASGKVAEQDVPAAAEKLSASVGESLTRGPAMAEECSIPWETENRVEKIVAVVAAKEDCEEALEYAENCSYGSAADAMIAGAARTVCEKSAAAFIKKDEKAAYKKLQEFCDRKYSGKDGTLYTSMNAFCKTNAARFFATLYGEGA